MLGKIIETYLMDGTTEGRWQTTLSNWNVIAFKIPRTMLKNCSDIPEISTPGVYFLFGHDDATDKPFVYIGEADNVVSRLLQLHPFEKDDIYWTECIIVVTPDGTLEKGRIKYLENRFYSIAKDAKRYEVKNANTPKQSPVSRQIRDLLEECIINVQLIVPTMGQTVFTPSPSAVKATDDNEENLLYFSRNKGQGGNATGKLMEDGFWVLQGSYIYPVLASYYIGTGLEKARTKYAEVIDKNGFLQRDVVFGSPSTAASFVCGKSVNGLTEWKNKKRVNLKDLNSEQSDATKKANGEKTGSNKTIIESELHFDKFKMFHLQNSHVRADGNICGNGFVVLKGSQISKNETKSCPNGIRTRRAQLVTDAKVTDGIFTEDVFFTSSSTAASVVLGASANGKIEWKDIDGKTLKQYESGQ